MAPREGRKSGLEAALGAVEQRLDTLSPDADADAVTAALDGVLTPLARAAEEGLR